LFHKQSFEWINLDGLEIIWVCRLLVDGFMTGSRHYYVVAALLRLRPKMVEAAL